MPEERIMPKLLIVEDDAESQKVYKILLGKIFELEMCESEVTFYQKLSEFDCDIILMDISIQGEKDGLQLTKEMRLSSKYKDIPIVCLSAHAFQRDRENALHAGVDMFLTKPIQNKTLIDSLGKVLKNKTGINISSAI